MSDPAKYIVGWICALTTEYVAAQEFLDEEHEGPTSVSSHDPNDYTLGKIGEHNVVIAVLPDGEYGIAPAASVAANMLNSFPNIRIGLMVGIGGGAPSEQHDIRLGDVVVSAVRDGQGGVFQYDFGKSIQAQRFEYTRFLDQPPTALRTAISGIQAQYKRKGHKLAQAVDEIITGNPRLRREYGQPPYNTDQLFKADVIHDPRGCEKACATNPSNLVLRRKRTEYDDNPTIHYGLIASANRLMKDASIRDRLARERDVLCFDMEAAGLVNSFPCLVIRGICDYSDSHKNKKWQGYAAMVAAAYTKDLLARIPPNKVETERKVADFLCDLQSIADNHRNIAQRQLDIHESKIKQKLSDKQSECLHLFRLTSNAQDITYEWYKDRVDVRVEGTCEWFLNHDNFRHWLHQDSGPLLVSADPGCGKSVLAKYLIDESLPHSATICYFFFKSHDQNTVRQALCALLHQLFSQRSFLIKYAMEAFRKDGHGLINSTTSLWTILGNAVRDPMAGPIIIVLDALDECTGPECEDLIRKILSYSSSGHSNRLKWLLTSRPYEQIIGQFRSLLECFPYVRIPGEEESESIIQEVNLVVKYRTKQLAKQKDLSIGLETHLVERLLGIQHRTYLWVYLVFDYLKNQQFKKTTKGIDEIMKFLPTSVHEAYEQILAKSSQQEPMVRRALCIILVASRPLTVPEMNIALSIDKTTISIDDIDLEEDDDFRTRLRNWCGLFVSVHHDQVYFIHQTAREFLLAQTLEPTVTTQDLRWQHSINNNHAHAILAEVCVMYLDFLNNGSRIIDAGSNSSDLPNKCTFLDYSAKNWGTHYSHASSSIGADLVSSTLRICSPDSRSWSIWFTIFWEARGYPTTEGFTTLMISCYFGHENIVRLLLDRGACLESKTSHHRTSLSYAAENGYEAIVELLVARGANLDSEDDNGRTPLSYAAQNGHKAIVMLLLDSGASPESADHDRKTPLVHATRKGHGAIVKLLIDRAASLEYEDCENRTALSYAAENGYETTVELLVVQGANLDSEDDEGRTPLSYASKNGHKAIAEMLVHKGAASDYADHCGATPLSIAAEEGHEAIVKFLVDCGAGIESKDMSDRTPLSYATDYCHESIVKLLLDQGASLESKDMDGLTPLLYAAHNGDTAIAKLLLDYGASLECRDIDGRTPLFFATDNVDEAMAKLLIDQGARVDCKDMDGRTPLFYATENGDQAIVKLLLNKGASLEPEDNGF